MEKDNKKVAEKKIRLEGWMRNKSYWKFLSTSSWQANSMTGAVGVAPTILFGRRKKNSYIQSLLAVQNYSVQICGVTWALGSANISNVTLSCLLHKISRFSIYCSVTFKNYPSLLFE